MNLFLPTASPHYRVLDLLVHVMRHDANKSGTAVTDLRFAILSHHTFALRVDTSVFPSMGSRARPLIPMDVEENVKRVEVAGAVRAWPSSRSERSMMCVDEDAAFNGGQTINNAPSGSPNRLP
jgi:hypothetical protein